MKNLTLALVCSFLFGNTLIAQNDLSFASISFNHEQNLLNDSERPPDFNYAPLKEPKIQKIIKDIQSLAIYPTKAEEYGVEGTVKLELLYDGTIQNIHVLESNSVWLEDAAIDAVQRFALSHSKESNTEEIVEPFKISVLFRFTL